MEKQLLNFVLFMLAVVESHQGWYLNIDNLALKSQRTTLVNLLLTFFQVGKHLTSKISKLIQIMQFYAAFLGLLISLNDYYSPTAAICTNIIKLYYSILNFWQNFIWNSLT